MGSIAKITVYAEDLDDSAFSQSFQRIQEIEDKMTINKILLKVKLLNLITLQERISSN